MSRSPVLSLCTCRRTFMRGAVQLLPLSILPVPLAAADTKANDRFDYLSTHGNSSCSTAFLHSILTMPETAKLQGSCCSPMERTRYENQIRGLARFSAIPEIPPDPYDIAAGLAQKLIRSYDLVLTPKEQAAYQYAMEHSEEKGPCCCQCWRWNTLGGLAKSLIRDRRFTGPEVTEVWNLTNGCGGV